MRWFYTGDIGQFHADGCLEIIDRKKDIVKLQHGEYVSLGKVWIICKERPHIFLSQSGREAKIPFFPLVQVEAALSVSPYADNIMIYANPFHSYCVALVVVSHLALEEWASKRGISFTDIAELCEREEAIKEVYSSLIKVRHFLFFSLFFITRSSFTSDPKGA